MNEYGDGLKCSHAHTAQRRLSKVKVVNRRPWVSHSGEHRSSCPGSGSSPTSLLGPLVTARTFPLPRVLQMASRALKVLGPRPAARGPSTRSRVVRPLERTSRLILSYRLVCRRHDNQWPFPRTLLELSLGEGLQNCGWKPTSPVSLKYLLTLPPCRRLPGRHSL